MRRLITVLAAIGLLLSLSGITHGSEPAPASGTFTVSSITSFAIRPVGPNFLIEQTTEGVVSGTLTGTFEDSVKVVVNPTANKVVQSFGSGTCVCTVAGSSGTLEYVLSSRGAFDAQFFEGRMVITGGTGDLSGLRGVLELEGTVDLNGLATIDYVGQIHDH
jgi:hypothetical protein